MSIAEAADRTNDDVRNASAQARFDHAAHHALNDNLETLFRWRDILRQRAITFEVDDIAACRATSRGILQVEHGRADQPTMSDVTMPIQHRFKPCYIRAVQQVVETASFCA